MHDVGDAFIGGASGAVAATVDLEDEEIYDNGVHVVLTSQRPACGASKIAGGKQCGVSMRMCRAVARGCTASANVACFDSTSRTDGLSAGICMPTYGECDRLRAVGELSREYDTTDCVVYRWRR